MSREKRWIARLCKALGVIIIVAVIVLCAPLTIPNLMGYETYDVISGSMEPTISVGSIIYTEKNAPADAASGDIIAYYGERNDGAVITHRVVENDVVTGVIVTKGDANEQNDPVPVSYDHYIGRVKMILPYFGKIGGILTDLYGKIGMGCLVAFALLLHIIGERIGREMEEQE